MLAQVIYFSNSESFFREGINKNKNMGNLPFLPFLTFLFTKENIALLSTYFINYIDSIGLSPGLQR